MTEEQFASYLERRLSLHDDQVTVLSRSGTKLQLRVAEHNVTLDLARFYPAYTAQPGALDTIAATMVRVLTTETPDREEQRYDALSSRIYPMLKPISVLATVRERNVPMIIYRDFLADLIVVYVIDENASVTFINERHLEQWDVSAYDVHEQAIINLRRRTLDATDYISTGEGEQRLFIFNSNDGYDAARLLLGDVLDGWSRQLLGRTVIGIPNRDFLIAFGDANDEIVRSIAHQVQLDSVKQSHGLTDQLFTLDDGQVREYQWD